ncbi:MULTISPECIES: glycosyltransferase family 4 protein [Flavobacterium]|jgi:glycosyltransferase involved in cell wall biosynthesis|uniref:glycosyltransferase family 4 protein n=1 Tax=Flavobacterium TaxID=237 RepID=UPI0022278AF6|nr:glycosyltransferase family 4 protein [Flavobacterium sp. 7A]MCW2119232.1 glycosyltransferase involved in cell wall biosynthesis [Flavobacterium sp. 7A]
MLNLLFFYPENPLLKTQGNNARAMALLNYFKSRSFVVDFVGIASECFLDDDIEKMKSQRLIRKGFLLYEEKRKKNRFRKYFDYFLPKKNIIKVKDFDRTKSGYKKQFNQILEQNQYDYVVVSYLLWTEIINDNPNLVNTVKIVDTHDFLTAHFAHFKKLSFFEIGEYFETEMQLANQYDKIIVISNEEKYIFEQFLGKPVHMITHSVDKKELSEHKTYDLIYVASDNGHNVKSCRWFFEKVYPLLDKNITILVVGKITNFAPDKENVTKISFIDNLDEVYCHSRVGLCPMLSGTGLKIKVIEALSFGLPVICNTRGVDGLLNKSNNGCLVTDDETHFAKQIELLLSDSQYYQKVSTEAKIYFDAHHNVSSVYDNFDKLFNF